MPISAATSRSVRSLITCHLRSTAPRFVISSIRSPFEQEQQADVFACLLMLHPPQNQDALISYAAEDFGKFASSMDIRRLPLASSVEPFLPLFA